MRKKRRSPSTPIASIFTIGLMAALAIDMLSAYLCLGSKGGWARPSTWWLSLTESERASWIQAVGSLAALGIAVYLSWSDRKNALNDHQREVEERQANEAAVRKMAALRVAVRIFPIVNVVAAKLAKYESLVEVASKAEDSSLIYFEKALLLHEIIDLETASGGVENLPHDICLKILEIIGAAHEVNRILRLNSSTKTSSDGEIVMVFHSRPLVSDEIIKRMKMLIESILEKLTNYVQTIAPDIA